MNKKLAVPYPEKNFKKSKKIDVFSKTQRQITFVQKMSFWTKTQRQIEFYCPENFEILCYDLSKISKNPKNDLFFTHLVRVNGFEKNQKFKFKSIILRTNYEKKVDFVNFFQEKIDFFQILCHFFHFVLNKPCFFEYDNDFIFLILSIFQDKKSNFSFCGENKNCYFQKKLFISICLRRKKNFHFKIESSSMSCPRAKFLCDKNPFEILEFCDCRLPFWCWFFQIKIHETFERNDNFVQDKKKISVGIKFVFENFYIFVLPVYTKNQQY